MDHLHLVFEIQSNGSREYPSSDACTLIARGEYNYFHLSHYPTSWLQTFSVILKGWITCCVLYCVKAQGKHSGKSSISLCHSIRHWFFSDNDETRRRGLCVTSHYPGLLTVNPPQCDTSRNIYVCVRPQVDLEAIFTIPWLHETFPIIIHCAWWHFLVLDLILSCCLLLSIELKPTTSHNSDCGIIPHLLPPSASQF